METKRKRILDVTLFSNKPVFRLKFASLYKNRYNVLPTYKSA